MSREFKIRSWKMSIMEHSWWYVLPPGTDSGMFILFLQPHETFHTFSHAQTLQMKHLFCTIPIPSQITGFPC